MQKQAARAAVPAFSSKVRIAPENCREEREADRIANSVIRGDNLHSRLPLSRREGANRQDEVYIGNAKPFSDGEIRRITPIAPKGNRYSLTKEADQQAAVEAVLSGGRPLPFKHRSCFERYFGTNLSPIRIHNYPAASAAARGIKALAYTVGNNIVFAPGQFKPDDASGKHLLAHEIVHTFQQQSILSGKLIQCQYAPTTTYGTALSANDLDLANTPQLKLLNTRLQVIINLIRLQAKNYTENIYFACDDFKEFALPLVKNLESEVDAGEIISTIASVFVGKIADKVKNLLPSNTLFSLANAGIDALHAKIVKSIKHEVSKSKAILSSDDIQSLREAVSLMAKATKKTARHPDRLIDLDSWNASADSILLKRKKGLKLDSLEEILLYVTENVGPSALAKNLEKYFRIPGKRISTQARFVVYETLVEEFMHLYLKELNIRQLRTMHEHGLKHKIQAFTYRGMARRIAKAQTKRYKAEM